MHHTRRLGLALVLALATLVPRPAAADVDSVLLIGNSFSEGIRNLLRSIERSAGYRATVGVCAQNGWTLANHAASRSTAAKIGSEPWQTVVLQEQSDGIDWGRYPAARALDAESPNRTVFFMTWRDRGASLGDYDSLLGVPGGDVGYIPIAYELGASVAPIGWAFRQVLLEDPSADLWSRDGHHAGDRGRYLAALVLFATIHDESTVGLWVSPRVPADVALHDQLLVDDLVLGNAAEWNLPPP